MTTTPRPVPVAAESPAASAPHAASGPAASGPHAASVPAASGAATSGPAAAPKRARGTSRPRAWLLGLSLPRHIVAVVVAGLLLVITNTVLELLYAASGFPVSFAEGQTSFSGEQVREWYAVMIEGGTLGVYFGTQLFDYLFMASVALAGWTAGWLVQRLAEGPGWLRATTRWLGRFVRWGAIAGALCDACENLVSFPMIAAPATFVDGWAVAQSTLATVKFGFMGVSMMAASLAAVALLVIGAIALAGRKRRRLARG